jgi:DNA-directed RNA polymerase alpha subunit
MFLKSFYPTIEPTLFFHCVDSRLDEDGKWYSRIHLGPFQLGSRLQVGTRLRRSLLNDLSQTFITAVKLEGAKHEFSRLHGTHEPVIDLLFQFRKLTLYAPFFKNGEIIIIPFIFSGPGIFYAKDIYLPNRIQCRNPEKFIVTLAPGSILRGNILIQKLQSLNKSLKLGEPWDFITQFVDKKSNTLSKFPWLSLGTPNRPVERVGFRIELLKPKEHLHNEILIFEIITNGRISPNQAIREAALLLVYKFSAIANILLPANQKDFSIVPSSAFDFKKKILIQPRSETFNTDFHHFQDPLSLDLGNLDLNKKSYGELRSLGFQTVGKLLERLAFNPHIFSSTLRKHRHAALFRIGLFPNLNLNFI